MRHPAAGVHEHVHDQGVLIDLCAPTVRGNAVRQNVAEVAAAFTGVTRHLHNIGVHAIDQRHAQRGAHSKRRLVWIGAGVGSAPPLS